MSLRNLLALAFLVSAVVLLTGAFLATGSTYHSTGPVRLTLYIFLPIGAAAVLILSVWLSHEIRLVIAITGLSAIAAVYLFEVWIAVDSIQRLAPGAIQSYVAPNVAIQDRRLGEAAYPWVCAQSVMVEASGNRRRSALEHGGEELQHLAGGVSFNRLYWDPVSRGYVGFDSNAPITLSDQMIDHGENGFAPLIRNSYPDAKEVITDRYGFNNPDDQWTRGVGAYLAVGDSYTWGFYAPPGESFVDLLRDQTETMVNIGCGGSGPLLELASFIEYGPLVRPHTTLWFYFEGNDITADLKLERRSSLLMSYLNPGTAFDLPKRQAEVDAAIIEYLSRRTVRTTSGIPLGAGEGSGQASGLGRGIVEVAKLANLRNRILSGAFRPVELQLYERILRRARDFAATWGGRIIFVYLPTEARYQNILTQIDNDTYRRQMLEMVESLGLSVIDVTPAFDAHVSPRTLFGDHYSDPGSRLVAEIVGARLTPATNP